MGNRTFAEHAKARAPLALKWLLLCLAFSFAVSPLWSWAISFEQALTFTAPASFITAVIWSSQEPPHAAVKSTAKGLAGCLLAGLGWMLILPALIWAPIAWMAGGETFQWEILGVPFGAIALAAGVVATPVLMILAGRQLSAS